MRFKLTGKNMRTAENIGKWRWKTRNPSGGRRGDCRRGSYVVEAATGTRVYVFPEYGSRYHLSGCRVLERRCIEIEKDVAKARKYTPCSKCGG